MQIHSPHSVESFSTNTLVHPRTSESTGAYATVIHAERYTFLIRKVQHFHPKSVSLLFVPTSDEPCPIATWTSRALFHCPEPYYPLTYIIDHASRSKAAADHASSIEFSMLQVR